MAIVAAELRAQISATGAAQARGEIDSVGQSINRVSGQSKALGYGLLGGAAGIAGIFTGGISAAANFEQAMADVRAVTSLTGDQFGQLSDLALQIGQDTNFSATEAASALGELSKAGVSVEDILSGAAEGTVALAAATGTSLPNAAVATANAMNIFSLSGDQATRVANVFAAAANTSATDVEQLQAGLAQGGAGFAMYGMTVEESVGALAMFSDYGIRGSDAATSLNAAFRTMNSGVGASKSAMDELGISLYDTNGQFIGTDGVAAELQRTLGGLTEEQRNLYLQQLGGADGMRALNILYEEGAPGVNGYTDAVTGTDAAMAASAIRMDTLNGVIEGLKGSLETLAITFMSGLLPGLKAIVKALIGFTNFFTKLPTGIQTAIVAFTALAGIVAAVAGAFVLFGPQIAAVGAILLGLAGPVAALIAVAAGLYVAWKTNFLGIRKLVQGALKPIIGFIDLFRNAFKLLTDPLEMVTGPLTAFANAAQGVSDGINGVVNPFKNAASAVNGFASATGRVAAPMGTVEAVIRALAIALRSIGDDDIGWINTLANGLDRVAGFVNRFKSAWDALGIPTVMDQISAWGNITSTKMGFAERAMAALDIATGGAVTRLREMTAIDIAVSIGKWAISAAVDLGTAIWDWITGTAIPGIGRAARDIGTFAVSIAGWTITFVSDLWEAIKREAFGAGEGDGTGGAGNTSAISLGSIAVSIADWAVSSAINLGQRVLSWITSTVLPGVSRAALDIGMFAVSIADWTVSAAVNIGQRVLSWITGTALPGISHAAMDIGVFAVSIADWLVSSAVNLGQRVLSWITSTALPGVSKAALDIGMFAVSIADWAVSALVNIGQRVWGWITTAAAGISHAAKDIGSFALSIADWTVTAAVNLGQRVWSWITGTALPAISHAAMDIGTFAVSIKDWVVSTAVDLGQRVWSWITGTALPAISRVAMDIGPFAVSIADWAVSAAVNLGQRVWAWITGTALPAISHAAMDIGPFAVSIADWTVTAAVNLGQRVWSWITGTALPAISHAAMDIGPFAVSITDWAVSATDDLWAKVKAFVTGGSGANRPGSGVNRPGSVAAGASAGSIGLGSVAVSIGSWDLSGSVDIQGKILDWVTGKIEGVEWMSLGHTVGVGVSAAILGGIYAAIIGMSWDKIGNLVLEGIKAYIKFEEGFYEGIWDGMTGAIDRVPWSDIGTSIKDKMVAGVKGIGQAMWDAIWGEFTGAGGDNSTDDQQKELQDRLSGSKQQPRQQLGFGSQMPQRVAGAMMAPDTSAALSALNTLKAAYAAIPRAVTTTIKEAGGAGVAVAAGLAKLAIASIPMEHLTSIKEAGALLVTNGANLAKQAIASIPASHLTAITEAGAAGVAGMSNLAKAAITAIPVGHFTAIKEAGASIVASASGMTKQAIDRIPTGHFTSIKEAGASAVTSSSNTSAGAIRGIPTSHFTQLSIGGAGSFWAAANSAKAAIASIPSSKTTYLRVVGGVGRATGGYVNEPITRLAERGAELLRYPGNRWSIAAIEGLYTVPKGTYVYTAQETRRMMKVADRIKGFAGGGYVASSRGSSSPPIGANVPPPRHESSPITVQVHVTVQGNVTAEDDLALSLSEKIVPQIIRARQEYNRSMGVT